MRKTTPFPKTGTPSRNGAANGNGDTKVRPVPPPPVASAAPANPAVPLTAAPEKETLYRRWIGLWSIDLRTLGLFRIALAAIVLFDLFDRLADLGAHYSDFGILPRSVLFNMDLLFGAKQFLPLYLISGETWVIGILFAIQIAAALAMLLGWQTRITTAITWYMMISLQARNPLILNGSDVLLRQLLLWCIFLPVGARFSLDFRRAHQNAPPPQGAAFSAASIGVLAQVFVLYAFTAYLKKTPAWTSDLTAVYYALRIEQYATPLGQLMLLLPMWVLKTLTAFTMILEGFGPLLMLIPSRGNIVRTFGVLLFVGFHGVALNLLFDLGGFHIIASAAWLAFLPREAWDWLEARYARLRANNRLPRFVRLTMTDNRERVTYGLPLFAQYVAGALLVYIILWNLRGINYAAFRPLLPPQADVVAQVTRTDQYWAMFAPKPTTEDGWFVVPGRLRDGRMVDVFRDVHRASDKSPLTWEKPPMISRTYKNERWRKYFMNIWMRQHSDQRLHLARWVCRSYNDRRTSTDRILDSFEIYFMLREPLPDNKTKPVVKTLLWSHYCFGMPPDAAKKQAEREAAAVPGVLRGALPKKVTPMGEQPAANSGNAAPILPEPALPTFPPIPKSVSGPLRFIPPTKTTPAQYESIAKPLSPDAGAPSAAAPTAKPLSP